MFAWIAENIGTIVVAVVLVGVVAAIVRSLIKDKKQGKSSCGGNCAHCGGACHYCKEGTPHDQNHTVH